MMRGANIGSGQRRFSNIPGVIEWVNADIICREGQRPDALLSEMEWVSFNFDYIVLWHVIEHAGCGAADALLKKCYDALVKGGQLIIAVPDLRALAQRWLMDKI